MLQSGNLYVLDAVRQKRCPKIELTSHSLAGVQRITPTEFRGSYTESLYITMTTSVVLPLIIRQIDIHCKLIFFFAIIICCVNDGFSHLFRGCLSRRARFSLSWGKKVKFYDPGQEISQVKRRSLKRVWQRFAWTKLLMFLAWELFAALNGMGLSKLLF